MIGEVQLAAISSWTFTTAQHHKARHHRLLMASVPCRPAGFCAHLAAPHLTAAHLTAAHTFEANPLHTSRRHRPRTQASHADYRSCVAVGRAPFLSLSFRIYPALGQRMMRGRRHSMRVLDALVRHVLAGTRWTWRAAKVIWSACGDVGDPLRCAMHPCGGLAEERERESGLGRQERRRMGETRVAGKEGCCENNPH